MLGPLEIHTDDGVSIDVPGARLRALLVALALQPGLVVPKAALVDWIWGEQPPADAANSLQALVSRLRKLLPEGSLDGQPGGYRLTVRPGAVDAVRFEQLVEQARGGADTQRAPLLREAVDLWRGTIMQDVALPDSAAFDALIARFEGLRLAAIEDRYEAEIRLGGGPELVAELTELVAQAYRHIDVATTMLGTDADQPNVSAVLHDLRGYLAADIDEARAQHTAAFHAASAAGHAPLIAQILVGVAALALRADHDEQAARLLAACAGVRGLTDRSHPDIARIEQQALGRLGEARFTAVTRQGAQANWHELATAALAS